MKAKARWRELSGVLAVACLVVAALLLQQPAHPASAGGPTWTQVVDSFVDEPDFAYNGVCSAGQIDGGPCTLRAALRESKGYLEMDRNVVIKLPPGTYALTQVDPDPDNPLAEEKYGDLDLLELTGPTQATVTIESTGPGPAIIDARGIDRVLEIGAHHNVILRNLEIRNGHAAEEDSMGGGIRAWGANLRLENVRLINNEAPWVIDGSVGGGLSVIDGNLIMERCELRGNRAAGGSALHTFDGSAGKDTYYAAIHQSAIHDNESTRFGEAIIAGARLFLVNSTVAGNRGSAGKNVAVSAQARAWIHNSTLQTAGAGVNLECRFKPCEVRNSALMTVVGAGGYPQNCLGSYGGSVVSAGGNVFDDGTCNPDPGLNDAEIMSDIWGLHPFTGLYFLPNKGSPVVNRLAGPCTGFLFFQGTDKVEGPITVDQRGAPRSDGRCDAGAIEAGRVWSYLPLTAR